MRIFWMCLAGALGTGARYWVTQWAGGRFGTSFPYGTLIVNLVGCFLIALIMQWSLRAAAFPAALRLVLTTGFMGGLTTYSSFNYDTTRLWLEGTPRLAAINFLATTVGGAVAGLAGIALVNSLAS